MYVLAQAVGVPVATINDIIAKLSQAPAPARLAGFS